jgi:hypothetical protein
VTAVTAAAVKSKIPLSFNLRKQLCFEAMDDSETDWRMAFEEIGMQEYDSFAAGTVI